MVGVASRAVLIWRYLASWGMFLDGWVTGDGEVVPEDRDDAKCTFSKLTCRQNICSRRDAIPTHVPGFVWRFYCRVDRCFGVKLIGEIPGMNECSRSGEL